MYAASVADPDAFWGEQGKRLDWIKPYTRVKNTSFDYHDVSISWFEDGVLNVVGQLHRPPPRRRRGEQTAILWESDDPAVSEHISYRQLHARGLPLRQRAARPRRRPRATGSCIYLPMIPRGRLRHARLRPHRRGPLDRLRRLLRRRAALAASRTAARKLVITADEAPRGGRRTPLKTNADKALAGLARRARSSWSGAPAATSPWDAGPRHLAARGRRSASPPDCPPEPMAAEDPLFILYTSGSTGKPKGVRAHHRRLPRSTPR